MYKKISNQSPKKAGTFGNIPATFLKESSEICNIVLKNAWNYEFITPVYKNWYNSIIRKKMQL